MSAEPLVCSSDRKMPARLRRQSAAYCLRVCLAAAIVNAIGPPSDPLWIV